MPLTSVFAEIETLVLLERPKVAISVKPFGTVIGVQFVALFQSPEPGLRSHTALAACVIVERTSIKPPTTRALINLFINLIVGVLSM